ncbi:PorP/SprF family type IX secretion system membrane protein [Muriicola sp.]|uniref:PorP/SprF family type IX secretion system membrane protein n=1 Tax=Muriicola sp. TaxID=2020856 RepID=UPI003C742AF4
MFCNNLSIFKDSVCVVHFRFWALIMLSLSFSGHLFSQDETPFVSYNVPFQYLLKFKRFLINPTFSTVREDKSYINFFHRSQSAYFQDNNQNYFLSYSGRINDRTGLGISVYNQQQGLVSNIGVLTNYAYGIRLSDKSNLTFGFNIPYYRSSFDESRAITNEEDPVLNSFSENSVIAFQPGINVSFGSFDVGLFAENIFDFNFKTGESITEFNEKSFSGHLQYTRNFEYAKGIFEKGRLMPLARIRKVGEEEFNFGGGIILDLPRLGWLQAGYDSFYGGSAGAGFNVNSRLSLGYNFERGFAQNINNFGITHEISIAYNFIPTLTEDMVQRESDEENDTDYLDVKRRIKKNKNPLFLEMDKLRKLNRANYAVINELIYKLDSLENFIGSEMERRFELAVRSNRQELDALKAAYGAQQQPGVFAKNEDPNPAKEQYRLTEGIKMQMQKNLDSLKRLSQVSLAPNKKETPNAMVGNLLGIPEGHYVIANVFETQEYLEKFLADLKEQGITAGHFKNPINGLNYVYLAHYEGNEEDLEKVKTNFREKYGNELWIMSIEKNNNSRMATLNFDD